MATSKVRLLGTARTVQLLRAARREADEPLRILDLPNLANLSVEAARILAASSFDGFLCLGLRKISNEVAYALTRNAQFDLVFTRMQKLTGSTAKALSGFSGSLHFEAIAEISPSVARTIAVVAKDAQLSFRRLELLTPAVARALAYHRHELHIRTKMQSRHLLRPKLQSMEAITWR